MKLLVAALAVALAGAGGGDGRTFVNGVYGHTLRLPAGWQARLQPGTGLTNASTYRVSDLGAFYERPPAGQVRIVLYDDGRGRCPRGSFRRGERIRLGPRSRFEGYGVGYNVLLCLRDHSLQAFVKAGRDVRPARLAQARDVLASVRLTRRADEVANIHSARMLGRSQLGRPIRIWRIGNPRARRRVLVVGCIHGNECAGKAVTARLLALTRPLALDLWVLPNLNPDGAALAVRQNGRGVDLNRNFGAMWKPIGRHGSPQYAGPRPWSERETRIARRLLGSLRPDVTIWFHQPQALVRAWGPSVAAARRFARRAGLPYRSLPWPNGTAANWQNHRFPGAAAFVVELSPGPLAPGATATGRYVAAILAS
ncbi:Zinc carboxypeptidase [Gaiella occulta]|uniref:Zinc carboxypeptidase n=1 Tax=Gaiella occulta TaxID=1002870 RepID=A0A7M2YUX6_9ACTN|nr:M14 family metallopeptidase [Gaiella occulta]RDI73913.1 Zinc carboxypeptidase [Gaiella occulta]